MLACWFASGIVFGFAALKPILIKEGVYQDLCTPDELEKGVEVCLEQDLRLNFFFSLASTTANLSALPVGWMLDRYGPKFCFLWGCLCLTIGSVLMSLAFQIEEFDGYTFGNFFLALGGNFIFLPSFQIANAFPVYAGSIGMSFRKPSEYCKTLTHTQLLWSLVLLMLRQLCFCSSD